MSFSALISQQSIAQRLATMWDKQRMPHALLLLGPEGCGKLALALALAKFLLCENKPDGDACGHCAGCHKMGKLVHPDLHFVFPVVGSKATSDQYLVQWRAALAEHPFLNVNDWLQSIGAENKQGNITKDECHTVIKKLSLKTFEGNAKVMLIWLPEYLGKEGNRLLKIIEEPPADTYFILVAEDAELILNTILSRCQLIKLNALQDEEIMEGLRQAYPNTEKERLQSVTYLAGGNFNEARKLMDSDTGDHAQLFLEWLRKAYKGNGVEIVSWVETFAKVGRENQKQFFLYGLHFLRELLQLKVLPAEPARLGAKEMKTAQNLVKVLQLEQIDQMIGLFTNAAFHIERNANPKILMLDGSIQLSKIMKPRTLQNS